MLFNNCILSHNNYKIVYFLKNFVVFQNVINFYSRYEYNKNVFAIKIIILDIKIKIFIDENIVRNNVNYKIRYITNVQKIHRFFAI